MRIWTRPVLGNSLETTRFFVNRSMTSRVLLLGLPLLTLVLLLVFLATGRSIEALVNRAIARNAQLQAQAMSLSLEQILTETRNQLLILAARTESEIAELDTYEERQEFLAEIGLAESGVSRLIRAAYALLNLQTFFTAGADEVRAWTFMRGAKAPQCAGVIHTDFEKGFIRAEVIKYDDYVNLGGEQGVKEAGKLSVEGKDYVAQDGDIMHFRFNV